MFVPYFHALPRSCTNAVGECVRGWQTVGMREGGVEREWGKMGKSEVLGDPVPVVWCHCMVTYVR